MQTISAVATWPLDRTGEPDPEIQQLEEILGSLRHEGRPLEIPADLQVDRPRSFFRDFGPRLAIAAAIAMLLLIGRLAGTATAPAYTAGIGFTPKVPR